MRIFETTCIIIWMLAMVLFPAAGIVIIAKGSSTLLAIVSLVSGMVAIVPPVLLFGIIASRIDFR